MGKSTKISWCDSTINFWQGCHKVSEGCKYCYMYRDKKRYGQDANVVVRSAKATFNKPLIWGEPARVFVCSWSDFFIEEADPWRDDAYEIMRQTPHLTYLLLTKRPENIADRLPKDNQFRRVWLGVTAENQKQADKRIPLLLQRKVGIRFVSIEPCLSPINLGLMGTTPESWDCGHRAINSLIDWVIIGAESGPVSRLMDIEWARDVVRQCREANVACFVKQLHINNKLSTNIEEWPEDLRVQEIPIG